ncbi:MAG: hypothetical protein RLZZ373_2207 [Pseudomonadota bacterium]
MNLSRHPLFLLLPGLVLLAVSLRSNAAPVVAVPYYHTVDLLQMQRRHLHLPAARQFREQADALRTTLAQGCTDRARAPARLAWTGTMAAWTRLSAVSTGPLLLRRSTRAIDFQPTRPRLIEQAIDTLRTSGTTPTPPDAAQLERIGSPAKGLPALEWLLWSPAAPRDAVAVCPYAVALADDLVREATAVEAAWQAEETADEPDEAQQTAAFSELVNQWVGAVEALRWADIERPLRAGRDDKLGWPRQTSGQTALAWRSRWEAIRTLTRTPDLVPQEGAGLVTMALYLRGHGHLRLADTLDAATRQADAALKNLRPQDPPARLQAASRALTRLRTLIETDVAGAAKVSIGFSDADGD